MALRGCLAERNISRVDAISEYLASKEYYKGFDNFYSSYHPIHGPLSTGLAAVGVLMNLANIVVLTRPNMINSVNVVMTAIAACDLGLDLSYLLYLAHFSLNKADYSRDFFCDPTVNTWGWAVFQLFHAHFSIISHATSLWLAVGMAGLRHFILSRPHPTSNSVVKPGILVVFITAILLILTSIPHLMLYRINSVPYASSQCDDFHGLSLLEISEWNETVHKHMAAEEVVWMLEMVENSCVLRISSFWISGLCYKILPCAMLSVFMGLLISTVIKARERKRKMVRVSSQHSDQTTTMLILIVSVFLLSELPQGLLTVLSGLLDTHFYDQVYKSLGDFLDLLSLLNSLVTFILYCSMSGMYRKTFCQVFLPNRLISASLLIRTRWRQIILRRHLFTSNSESSEFETGRLMTSVKLRRPLDTVITCPTNGRTTEYL